MWDRKSASAIDPCIFILCVTWFCLCGSLVLLKWDLILIFYSFSGFSTLEYMLRLVIAKSDLCRNSEKSVANEIIGQFHSILQLHLMWRTKSFEFLFLCIISGYIVFDLWHKTGHRLFSGTSSYFELVHEVLLLVWFITVPLILSMMVSCDTVRLTEKKRLANTTVGALIFIVLRCLADFSLLWEICRDDSREEFSLLTILVSLLLLSVGVTQSFVIVSNICCAVSSTNAWKCTNLDADSSEANVWLIHGKRYNLNPFVKFHPGGSDAIQLGRGRDCTALFESYHPFTKKHIQTLEKYKVEVEAEGSTPNRVSRDNFYAELCDEVAIALKEHGLDPLNSATLKSTRSRMVYYLLVFVSFVFSYCMFVRGTIFGAVLLSVTSWLLGSLGHDGSHFAVSKYPLINRVATIGMMPLASPYMWLQQHTFAHHSHTNDPEQDPDLYHFSFIRTMETIPWLRRHRAQRYPLYIFSWYLLVVFGEALWLPLKLLLSGSINGVTDVPGSSSFRARAMQILHISLYSIIFVIAPAISSGSLWPSILFLFTAGLLFGLFSQINHLNGESVPHVEGDVTASWAKMQILTSNNYCTDSAFWTAISNGLNFQIEHHLFPGINHEHLRIISPVVKRTCEAHRIKYKCFNNFTEILSETMKYLRSLSSDVR